MRRNKRSLSHDEDAGRRPGPSTHSHVQVRENHGINIGVVTGNNTINVHHSASTSSTQKELDMNSCVKSLNFRGMNSREGNISFSDGTCNWLLDHQKQRDWRRMEQSLLWIRGPPGCGKSTLIFFLKSQIHVTKSPDDRILSFFFNARGEHLESSQIGFFRAILYQLLRLDQEIHNGNNSLNVKKHILERIATQTEESPYQWQEEELKRDIDTLLWPLAADRYIYLFVDALDEAGEIMARKLARYLSDLTHESKSRKAYLRICFSCREWPHLTVNLAQDVFVEQANAADIEKFVDKEFAVAQMPSNQFQGLRDKLIKKAKGIFQWVSLVTTEITTLFGRGASERELVIILRKLPDELKELYKSLLQSIHEEDRAQSRKLFQWICYATQQFTPDVLRYILALDCENPPASLDELHRSNNFIANEQRLDKNHPLLKRLKHLSRGLAEVSKGNNRVLQVVHETVNEYLKESGIAGLQDLAPDIPSTSAHWQISRTCLQYLRLAPHRDPRSWKWYERRPSRTDAFLIYTAKNWLKHVCEVEKEHIVQADLIGLLDEPEREKLETFYSLNIVASERFVRFWGWTLLHLAADQSLNSLLCALIESNQGKIDLPDAQKQEVVSLAFRKGDFFAVEMLRRAGCTAIDKNLIVSTIERASLRGHCQIIQLVFETYVGSEIKERCVKAALNAASSGGREEVVQLLLENNAEMILPSHYDEALQAASLAGQEHIVRLLHRVGENAIAQSNYGKALQAASHGGNKPTVQLVLSNGAKSIVESDLDQALREASRYGHTDIVELLLDAGANVNSRGDDLITALTIASDRGHKNVVALLLKKRADANKRAADPYSALKKTSRRGHKAVPRPLIEQCVDINAQGYNDSTALQAASRKRHGIIVNLLLDHGADINFQREKPATALQEASFWGFTDMVQLLLDRGADANVWGGERFSALYEASLGGHNEIVQLLLSNAADVNAQGGDYGNALQAASSRGHKHTIELLLLRGANINTLGGECGTALQAASRSGHKAVVELLLSEGAEINADGGQGTALQAASSNGRARIVQLLLGKGADINAPGGAYGSALLAASHGGHDAVTELLLSKGAEVNAEGGPCCTALQAAAYMGSPKIIRLLLRSGAHINAQGGRYGTALQAATFRGTYHIVQLLLSKDAEVNAQAGKYSTALQAASYRGHDKVVQLLLDNGAEINAEGGKYWTALQAASYGGHERVVQLLLSNGADINLKGRGFDAAIQAASYGGRVKVVQLLLSNGADIHLKGRVFGTALQAAAYGGHNKVIQLLLDNGADVNAQGGVYGTALQAAAYGGLNEVIQLLLDNGANVNNQGGKYCTALQAASYVGQVHVVRLLIANRADVNIQGGEFGCALEAALSGGQDKVANLLLDEGAGSDHMDVD